MRKVEALIQSKSKDRLRNTPFTVQRSLSSYESAIESGLMQVHIQGRSGKTVILPNNKKVVEFINCSYLGLDIHPKIVQAYRNVPKEWGVNFVCARSRFSIGPLQKLEEALSHHFFGRVVTFPTVTATHLSVMPLLSSGVLFDEVHPPKVRMIFDRFAHASMQFLKPIVGQEALLDQIPHNDLDALRTKVLEAKSRGEIPVYVADGVYSMGGVCPIADLLKMAQELDFYLYLDDAHGTSIFGARGEGPVLSQIDGPIPDRLFLAFSLTKGFGVSGGGILLSDKKREHLIRCYGYVYAFSAPLDFASIYACFESLKLHQDGTVNRLQGQLRKNVRRFDSLMGCEAPFSPIRMIPVGDERLAIEIGKRILDKGYFVTVAFFPVVPQERAQLRICIAANHSEKEIKGLARAIQEAQDEASYQIASGWSVE